MSSLQVAQVVQNNIVKLVNRPNWYVGGEPIDDAGLIAQGYYPIVYPSPEFDPRHQTIALDPFVKWTVGTSL